MRFIYEKDQFKTLEEAEKSRWIHGNGLGGYIGTTAAFSANRCDDGILCGAVQVPNRRKMFVHRLKETLQNSLDENDVLLLSSQRFADGRPEEAGYRYLKSFTLDALPEWNYEAEKLVVKRTGTISYKKNISVIQYQIANHSEKDYHFYVRPSLLMEYKGEPVQRQITSMKYQIDGCIATIETDDCEEKALIASDGRITGTIVENELLAYPADGKDGRADRGYAGSCIELGWEIPSGQTVVASILFAQAKNRNPFAESTKAWEENLWIFEKGTVLSSHDIKMEVEKILQSEKKRREALLLKEEYSDSIAQELCRGADLYLSEKETTGGVTLLAGFPLFGDWGRDTMISLAGCTLATGKYKETRELLGTFLKYEKDGLLPNLFPEKGKKPEYNAVDAPLLLIESLWLYLKKTNDWTIVEEYWESLLHIMDSYQKGTHFQIHMDEDGLITQGEFPWQLTWMDARVGDFLPTPRYGKPVEINAYWYNALCIMGELADKMDRPDLSDVYRNLAQKVKVSFLEKFWMPEKGYLKDLISGTKADEQFRCNQIWALTMSYTMLKREQEASVLKLVKEKLYTGRGLRTLAQDDPEYQGFYGGSQYDRDIAYHQGTVWVFPMGAYYRAILKVGEYSVSAITEVKEGLSFIEKMLYEGCAGQLPEIYDGDHPYESKGCYAQCWSVGEILRVYEALKERAPRCS